MALELFFEMAKQMEKIRDGNPKYIIRKKPKVGKPVDVFEFYPDKEYHNTGPVTPDLIHQLENWYYLQDSRCVPLVVKYISDEAN